MANAQWSQLGPGQGGQHRANYLYQHGTLYDVYIGSDVSGVWVAKDIDEDNIAKYENYHYEYISNNKIMRFVNRFYNKSTFSSNQLFVTHRNGIERIDMTNPTAPMTSSFTNNDGWVSDMHIVGAQFNSTNQIYFVTGSVRLNDEPGNHKNTSSTNDFYYGQINASFNITSTGVNLPDLGLASPEKHVYCLWVDEGATNNFTDDQFMVGTEYGLYSFNYTNITNANIPTHVTGPTGIVTDAYKVTGITNISPNQFLINVAYQGLFLYNTTTQSWTTQITELMAESELNSNITYADLRNNPNAKAITQLLPFTASGAAQQTGWIMMCAENLITYQNQNYFVGAYYCPVISANNNLPDGHWKGFNTWVGNNSWGWNTSKPAANIYGSLVTPNNYLLDGKSGNAMITSEPIDDITPLNTLWNQTYCKPNIANNGTCSDKYEHLGLVNTAPKCIYKDNKGKIWLSQNDRSLWLSTDDGHEFQEILEEANGCVHIEDLLDGPGGCDKLPLSDCFFTINDPNQPLDLYAGVGEGFATRKGNGHVIKYNNATNIWSAVGAGFCGDPVKLLFAGTQLYCIINVPNVGAILHYYNGVSWLPCDLHISQVNLARDITDAVISPDGNDLFVIHNPQRGFHRYTYSSVGRFDLQSQCDFLGAPNNNPNNLLGKKLALLPYNIPDDYKVLMSTEPTSATPTSTENLYEVYNTLTLCTTQGAVAAVECSGNANIFQDLYIDDLDKIDGGINYIAVNTDLHFIYVAAVANNYNATTPVKSVLYKTDYDAATGAISNCWEDITGTLPNKAIQYISTNGSNQCTGEYLYAAVRGLGAWKLGQNTLLFSNVINTTCAGSTNGQVTINANTFTNPTYAWSNSSTLQTITGLLAGTYTVTVTNNGNVSCTISASVTITSPTITFQSTNATCNLSTNGTATANLINGGTPTLYDWGTVLQTTATVTGLAAATYPVSITDNNNCITTASVVITEPAVISAGKIVKERECNNAVGGGIELTNVTGGTLPFQFSLSGTVVIANQSYRVFANLPMGSYTVTVTDVNGCTLEKTAAIGSATTPFTGGTVSNKTLVLTNNLTLATNCTITNCNMYIDQGINITVPSIYDLNIINSTLTTCPSNSNWQGIVSTTTGTITVQESNIENANVALDISNGKFLFQYSKFDNNVMSLNAHDMPFTTDCKIDECSFNYSKLPAFDNLLTPVAHLNFENCTGIGSFGSEDNTNPNYFTHARTAIRISNSNVNVFNSKFDNIGADEVEQNNLIVRYGNGIYGYNTTASTLNVNINRSGSFNACTFYNTVNPIWLDGKFNTNIADNFFDVCLTPVFVMKSQGLGNTININNNNFRNYRDGITTYDCFSSTINITNNLFNMFDANTTIPFSAAIYSVRAITIRELKGTLRLNILGNKMNNTREGIYCINVKAAAMGDVNIGVTNVDPDIFSNEYFNIVPQANLAATGICYGYNFINCFKIKVAGNFAQWNSIPTLTELKLLRGISNTTGMSNSFAQNKTLNMGAGFRFWGDCSLSEMHCNTMTANYHGVYIDPNGINNKLTDQGDVANSTAWKNKWISNVDPNNKIGGGNIANFFSWLYKTGSAPEFIPVTQLGNITPQSCTNEQSDCAPPAIVSDQDRERAFGAVANNAVIIDPDSLDFYFNNKEAFFQTATDDNAILNMGTTNDYKYQQKYNYLTQTNFGKYEDVKNDLANNQNSAAINKMASIIDSTQQEQNLRFVFGVLAVGYSTNEDTDKDTANILTAIALMHPFYGGEAVFIARAILPLDVEDEIPPQRKAHMQHQIVQDKHAKGTLVPNPAKYNVLFTYTNESAEPLQIQVTDVLGNDIETYEMSGNELKINTTKYIQGVYFLHVLANGMELEKHKLVIIK